jgi:hypothetical protein
MSKFLITTAFALALSLPAHAESFEFTPKNMASILATMMAYDIRCGGLPPKTKQFSYLLMQGVDQSLATSEAMNVALGMNKIGIKAWCDTFRPTVKEMEAAQ